MKRILKARCLCLVPLAMLFLMSLRAQGPPPDGGGHMPPRSDHGPGSHGPPPPSTGGMGRVAPGRWWRDPDLIRQLDLSVDQQKKIDAAYQQSRIRLIDLNATVQKEQAQLEPLLDAEHLDEARIVAQIDRVAAARAELEKTNSRMLLSMRAVLTQSQWRRLQTSGRPHEGH